MFNRSTANHPVNIIHEDNGSYTVNVSGESSITIDESRTRKANTKTARSELSNRVRKTPSLHKPSPTSPADQAKSDADWQRLMDYAASQKKPITEDGIKGKARSASVRKAISRAMKGHSNFEGKTHTKKSKIAIQLSRGHDDRIQGKKWSYDKATGKTNRTRGLPDDHKWGRGRSTANRTKRKLSDFGK